MDIVDYSYKFLNSPVFKLSIEEANNSQHQQRVAAVIFKNRKRIISSAYNEVRGNSIPPKFKNFPESAHAECLAIKRAYRDLRGYSMLVVRVNRKSEILLAKPCSFCQAFADFCGIRNIYYSTSDGRIVKEDN